MTWFEEHLHWTYLLGILFAITIIIVSAFANLGWIAFISVVIWVALPIWVLKEKGRSWGWFLLSFSLIGIIIIFYLDNNRIAVDKVWKGIPSKQ